MQAQVVREIVSIAVVIALGVGAGCGGGGGGGNDNGGPGDSGERLTRDEAFDLLRRAVASLATNDHSVRASTVRDRARELLGRDSESLSERNFTRILKDAHDADVVDLRRRGDDFEVARAEAAL